MKKLIIVLLLVGMVPLLCLKITFAQRVTFKARYISLAPSTTEILFALGLDEAIIGVSSHCNYPLKTMDKEKFGSFSQPNIEKIVSVNPDMVFATGLEQSQAVMRLKKLGFKVFVSDPKNINELFQSIIQIGELTQKEEESQDLVAGMRQRIETIKLKVAGIPQDKRPKVFVEIWHDPLMTAGPGSIIDEIVTLAGGENIAYDAPRAYSRFSAEVVVQRNPDLIILGYMPSHNIQDLVSQRLGWQNIKAVKLKRVISDINPDLILRPGPRIAQGIEEVFQSLYNE